MDDKALRLARILSNAIKVLGSTEKANRWINKPNTALGGKKPIEMLENDSEAEEVDQVLSRIEYGVYS